METNIVKTLSRRLICGVCDINPATHTLTTVTDGYTLEAYVCEACGLERATVVEKEIPE